MQARRNWMWAMAGRRPLKRRVGMLSWRARRAFEARTTHVDRALLGAFVFLVACYGAGAACRALQ